LLNTFAKNHIENAQFIPEMPCPAPMRKIQQFDVKVQWSPWGLTYTVICSWLWTSALPGVLQQKSVKGYMMRLYFIYTPTFCYYFLCFFIFLKLFYKQKQKLLLKNVLMSIMNCWKIFIKSLRTSLYLLKASLPDVKAMHLSTAIHSPGKPSHHILLLKKEF
jgi:hypothetical protein